MAKYVYLFGDGKADGAGAMKELLGGKGANLAEMTSIGLPVPPGFTLTTEVCKAFYDNQREYPAGLHDEVSSALKILEQRMGKGFGDSENPLLVSVRSGAPASMPGMMDTVLNLGLNDQTIQGVIRQSNDARFAYDSYRRFIQMYANVVKGMSGEILENILEAKKEDKGVEQDTELSADDLHDLVVAFKASYKETLLEDFPDDPQEQLWGAISAVSSYKNDSAKVFSFIRQILDDLNNDKNLYAIKQVDSNKEKCVNYMLKLAGNALSSFMSLPTANKNDLNALANVDFRYHWYSLFSTNAYEEYWSLRNELMQILYKITNSSFDGLYWSSFIDYDYSNYSSYVDMSVLGELDERGNYYFPMVAYRLLNLGNQSMDGYLNATKNSIANSEVSDEAKKEQYKAVVDGIEGYITYKLFTSPKVPTKESSREQIINTHKQLRVDVKKFMNENLWGEYRGLWLDYTTAGLYSVYGDTSSVSDLFKITNDIFDDALAWADNGAIAKVMQQMKQTIRLVLLLVENAGTIKVYTIYRLKYIMKSNYLMIRKKNLQT